MGELVARLGKDAFLIMNNCAQSNMHKGVQSSSDSVFSLMVESSVNFLLGQGELSRVLYPVFLHCYLRLVANEATPLAKSLLAK